MITTELLRSLKFIRHGDLKIIKLMITYYSVQKYVQIKVLHNSKVLKPFQWKFLQSQVSSNGSGAHMRNLAHACLPEHQKLYSRHYTGRYNWLNSHWSKGAWISEGKLARLELSNWRHLMTHQSTHAQKQSSILAIVFFISEKSYNKPFENRLCVRLSRIDFKVGLLLAYYNLFKLPFFLP